MKIRIVNMLDLIIFLLLFNGVVNWYYHINHQNENQNS